MIWAGKTRWFLGSTAIDSTRIQSNKSSPTSHSGPICLIQCLSPYWSISLEGNIFNTPSDPLTRRNKSHGLETVQNNLLLFFCPSAHSAEALWKWPLLTISPKLFQTNTLWRCGSSIKCGITRSWHSINFNMPCQRLSSSFRRKLQLLRCLCASIISITWVRRSCSQGPSLAALKDLAKLLTRT